MLGETEGDATPNPELSAAEDRLAKQIVEGTK
jgi:hypothetical protein